MSDLKKVKVGDYEIVTNTITEVIIWLVMRVTNNQTTSIVTINPEIYLKSLQNLQHFNAIKTADVVVADGMGIVWAGEYFNCKNKNKFIKFIISIFKATFKKENLVITNRITGVDLTYKLCASGVLPIKIFGSRLGNGFLAKDNLLKMFPNLKIDVYEDVEVNTNGQIIFGDDTGLYKEKCLLLLALGAPKQEILMADLKSMLIPGTIVIGVGGTIDFISGKVARAPIYLRNFGFEWLFRLAVEPKRFKRIINAIIVFPYKFISKY